MIEAGKNRFLEAWFRGYTRRYLQRSFHRVFLHGEPPQLPEGPVLVCLNHSSWWDLLLSFWTSREVLGWDAYGPMDQRQLQRYPILRGLGVFGVDRETLQGGREFLEYAERLLTGTQRSLWVTAQGAMVSNDVRPVRLYSGIARAACSIPNAHVATVVLDYEFWDEKRPEAFVSFGPVEAVAPGTSPRELLQRLELSLEQRMDLVGAARRERNPALFREALRSGGGISPAYDLIRRLGGAQPLRHHGDVATPPAFGPAAKR